MFCSGTSLHRVLKIGAKFYLVVNALLSGQKYCPDKNIVRTKKLSGQKKCLDKKIVRTKKLSGQKKCPDRKIVRTKKLSGQKKMVRTKNCPDKFFLSALAMPFFLSIWLFISEIFYNFLGILWAIVITTCLIKLSTELTKILLKIISPKVYERLF